MLTEEKLDEIGARPEHTPQKSLRHFAQETGFKITPSCHRLLKMKPFKTTVVHELQPYDSVNSVNFCNWILQSVHGGEIDPHLIFSGKAWLHLHGEVNSQHGRYWISHNPK
jgi:hypothetical protein